MEIYDESSFLMGIAAGRAMKGVSVARNIVGMSADAEAEMAVNPIYYIQALTAPRLLAYQTLTAAASFVPVGENIRVSPAQPPIDWRAGGITGTARMEVNDEYAVSAGNAPQTMGYSATVTATMEVENNG